MVSYTANPLAELALGDLHPRVLAVQESLTCNQMHYIDTGSRDRTHSLADWLKRVLTPSVSEVRWQSGFFNEKPLGLLAPTLRRLARGDRTVHALIGSNSPGTQRNAVLRLVQLLGLPRQHASLGVVRYGNAFYHPKTYHFRRNDGSQCAYVGSANLTDGGMAWHVEAGLTLDTEDGDPADVLNEIAAAVDAWFTEDRAGLHKIDSAADIEQLVTDGVLIVGTPQPATMPAVVGGGASAATPAAARLLAPQLSVLAKLPQLAPRASSGTFPVHALSTEGITSPTDYPQPAPSCTLEEVQLISRLSASEAHRKFRSERLQPKINREHQAWNLLNKHRGNYTRVILNTIFDTVDNEPGRPPWFGELLAKPNRDRIFQSSNRQISRWIEELLFKGHPYQEALTICLGQPRPSGASKGLATLFLYLSDPRKYNIWLPRLEKGLRIIRRLSTLEGDWGTRYSKFNQAATEFRNAHGLQPEEVDWMLYLIATQSTEGS